MQVTYSRSNYPVKVLKLFRLGGHEKLTTWNLIVPSADSSELSCPSLTRNETVLVVATVLSFIVAFALGLTDHFGSYIWTYPLGFGTVLLLLFFFVDEFYSIDLTRRTVLKKRTFFGRTIVLKRISFDDLVGLVVEKSTRYKQDRGAPPRPEGERHQVILLTKAGKRIPLMNAPLHCALDARVDARRLGEILGTKLIDGPLDKRAAVRKDVAGNLRVTWI
jgi:hypothetical protein